MLKSTVLGTFSDFCLGTGECVLLCARAEIGTASEVIDTDVLRSVNALVALTLSVHHPTAATSGLRKEQGLPVRPLFESLRTRHGPNHNADNTWTT